MPHTEPCLSDKLFELITTSYIKRNKIDAKLGFTKQLFFFYCLLPEDSIATCEHCQRDSLRALPYFSDADGLSGAERFTHLSSLSRS